MSAAAVVAAPAKEKAKWSVLCVERGGFFEIRLSHVGATKEYPQPSARLTIESLGYGSRRSLSVPFAVRIARQSAEFLESVERISALLPAADALAKMGIVPNACWAKGADGAPVRCTLVEFLQGVADGSIVRFAVGKTWHDVPALTPLDVLGDGASAAEVLGDEAPDDDLPPDDSGADANATAAAAAVLS